MTEPKRAPGARDVFRGRLVSVEVWPERYREIVRHPGSCAAVALDGTDVLMVRQLRDAVGERLLEIPAGTRDVEGEDPGACAAREVLEETGRRVARIEPLGWVYASPGFLDERVDLYLADLEPGEGVPAEEGIEVVRLPFADAVRMATSGEIRDAKSLVGLVLAAARRGG
ncbi:MAG TPA: NUDIX hydrolase [Actinomycetota bacterium]|nr:NUDIX hydrolase [Actinomycetota bacterium]